jgi:DNA-binding transcriptional MerR regulator
VTLAIEEKRIRSLFSRVETVEEVARTLPEGDERRAKLMAVSTAALADEGTIRPVIAARLLGLSEKTVRAWAAQGVLAVAQRAPRLLLDLQSVHVISHILGELRAAGQERDLLDGVWRRLGDAALLERPDLQESIEQMRQGRGRVLRPLRQDGAGSR